MSENAPQKRGRRGKYKRAGVECRQTWTPDDLAWIAHQVGICRVKDLSAATALAESARALVLLIERLSAIGELRTDSEQRVLAAAPGKLLAVFARLGTDQHKDDDGGRI